MPFRAFSQASVAVSSPLPVCFFFRLSFFLLFSLLLSFVQCLLEGKLSPKATDEVGTRQTTEGAVNKSNIAEDVLRIKVNYRTLPLEGKLSPKATDEVVELQAAHLLHSSSNMANVVKLLPPCQSARKPLYFQRFSQKFSAKTNEKQLTFPLKSC